MKGFFIILGFSYTSSLNTTSTTSKHFRKSQRFKFNFNNKEENICINLRSWKPALGFALEAERSIYHADFFHLFCCESTIILKFPLATQKWEWKQM